LIGLPRLRFPLWVAAAPLDAQLGAPLVEPPTPPLGVDEATSTYLLGDLPI